MKQYTFFSQVIALLDQWFTAALFALGHILRPLFALRFGKRETLLIKHVGGIGDYVLFTASFPGFRQLFPQAHIVLIVRREVGDLAKFNPYIDALITVNLSTFTRSLVERLRVWLTVVSHHADIAINADYSGHYEKLDRILLGWSMASQKIGFECLDKNAQRDTSFYDRVVPQQKEWMFEIDRNNEMLRYLGLPEYRNHDTSIWGLDHYLPGSDVERRLPPTSYYVLFPGSLIADKCWPAERFGSVVKSLEYLDCTPVVCGSARERDTAKAIKDSAASSIVDLTGRTNLMDLSNIIRHARFVISNDSAAVHIAAAVGTLTFAILGGGHYGRFVPYPGSKIIVPIINEQYRECFNCYWMCIYDRFRCIQDLQVDTVLKVIKHHLDEGLQTARGVQLK
jgi:ADP-heptose:LPS heptosyltransferase